MYKKQLKELSFELNFKSWVTLISLILLTLGTLAHVYNEDRHPEGEWQEICSKEQEDNLLGKYSSLGGDLLVNYGNNLSQSIQESYASLYYEIESFCFRKVWVKNEDSN